ncbi:MAG: YARHG domain-containing protein [Lachnospiraceae bacterium]|nr:YARHG domain-containing protein [Lachnospiraceae bacterium]
MKYCESCNRKLNDDDLFCDLCGSRAVDIPEFSDAPSETDPNYFDPYENTQDTVTIDRPYGQDADGGQDASSPWNPSGFDSGDETPRYTPPKQAESHKITIGFDVQKAKKPLIIVGILIVLMILGLIVFRVVSDKINKAPIKLSLSEYFSNTILTDADRKETDEGDYMDGGYDDSYYYDGYYDGSKNSVFVNGIYGPGLYVDGYNDYASVDSALLYNTIDWEKIVNDVNEALARKKTERSTPLKFEDFFDENAFSFSIDSFEDLSNEQVVTVSVNPSKDSFLTDTVTIEVSGGEHAYKIKGLETVTALDPFDYVQLATYGPNGNATAGCMVDSNLSKEINGLDGFRAVYASDHAISIEKDGYIVNKISFGINNSGERLRNGDTVSMYCSSEVSTFEEEYKVYIARYFKEYTVSGLGEYLTMADRLSGKDVSAFVICAKDKIKENFISDRTSNFHFVGVYFADIKDKTNLPSRGVNKLYVVYSYDYNDWWSGQSRKYVYVRFNDIISDGKLFKTAENYYDDYNGGYSDFEEMTSYFEDDGRNIVSELDTAAGSSDVEVTTVPQTTEEARTTTEPEQTTAASQTTTESVQEQVSSEDASGYLFPSDTQLLTTDYLDTLSEEQINLIRNEIYARHGYIFKKEVYKDYFEKQSWYHGTNSDMDSVQALFNDIELENIEILVKYQGL